MMSLTWIYSNFFQLSAVKLESEQLNATKAPPKPKPLKTSRYLNCCIIARDCVKNRLESNLAV